MPSPLEALGVILACKYRQFRQRRHEAANRRVTERELSALHYKIDKLLNKLEDSEPEPPTSQDDECVICIHARATMETSPCGHRVVCRRCFVKTIQSAVQARMLPLRCVICRARINRLTSGSGSWMQGSSSSYSMGSATTTSRSWGGVSGSASSFSMGQSSSLYSMSSGSASLMSGVSSVSSISGRSGTSNQSLSAASIKSASAASCSSSSSSSTRHKSNCTCSNYGCLGAIPRNPSSSTVSSPACRNGRAAIHRSQSPSAADTLKNVTNINYNLMYNNNNSPSESSSAAAATVAPRSSSTTVPNIIRSSRLPTIKESPVHISGNNNVKNRFSYTSPSANDNDKRTAERGENMEMVSMTTDPELNNNHRIVATTAIVSSTATTNKQHNAITKSTSIPSASSLSSEIRKAKATARSRATSTSATTDKSRAKLANPLPLPGRSKVVPNFKIDNKKEDLAEKQKKEEKAQLKAEKEAKKEEKRIAKEEEKLAKMLAKEEKKRLKREAKESLLTRK